MDKEQNISRQSLLDGQIKQLALERPGVIDLMPDDERERIVAETIANAPDKADFWVFAYGSLIWNPAIEFDAQCRCSIQGFHRSFCFWTMLGRGSEEQPGLMMGLEPGGSCEGIAYRIPFEALTVELDILYRREMMSNVYNPTWVEASCIDDQPNKIPVLSFVVDPENNRFCGTLDEHTTVSTLSVAEGPMGRNCDYLFQLVDHLETLGFNDPVMTDLANKVRAYQSGTNSKT